MGVVLGLIAISFAIWGIGDIFRGFGRSSLARIGGTEITIEQFRQLYNERLQQLGRQLGRPITLDQARPMGLDRQLVGQLIGEATLDERVEGAAARHLRRRDVAPDHAPIPTSRARTASSTACASSMLLRRTGITERRFVAEQRRQILRRQLAGTVRHGTQLPKAAIEAADRYQQRAALDRIRAARPRPGRRDSATRPPEALAKYYEERKALFRAPEYRKLVILPLHPGRAGALDVDLRRGRAEGLRGAPRRYLTPERRQLQQIVFTNEEEARRRRPIASPRARASSTIAKERKLTEKDIDLGTADQGRDHRPGGRRCRLRAQGGRGQRAGPRPLRHRARARASRSSRKRCARSRRSATSSAQGARERARQGRDPAALRQDRGRALDRPAAGGGRRQPQARGAHHRGRPARPRSRRARR